MLVRCRETPLARGQQTCSAMMPGVRETATWGVRAAGAGLPSSARSFVPRHRNRQAASRWKAIPRLTPSSERGLCSCVQRHSSRPLTDLRRQTQTSRVGGMVKPVLPARPRVVPTGGRAVEAERVTERARKGMTLVFMAHLCGPARTARRAGRSVMPCPGSTGATCRRRSLLTGPMSGPCLGPYPDSD